MLSVLGILSNYWAGGAGMGGVGESLSTAMEDARCQTCHLNAVNTGAGGANDLSSGF
jgi:hypothetical protein